MQMMKLWTSQPEHTSGQNSGYITFNLTHDFYGVLTQGKNQVVSESKKLRDPCS